MNFYIYKKKHTQNHETNNKCRKVRTEIKNKQDEQPEGAIWKTYLSRIPDIGVRAVVRPKTRASVVD